VQPHGTIATVGIDRREFLRRTTGVVAVGTLGPTLLAACGGGDESAQTVVEAASPEDAAEQARAVVGDVVDFALASDEWEGDFGFVTMRLNAGRVSGKDVYFIRTDASDKSFADEHGLVFVPKLAALANPDLAGTVYLDADAPDRPAIFSSEPGRDDYTPAWRVHRLRRNESPRPLVSVEDVEEAEREGAVAVENSGVVLNAEIVKWSDGELAVDRERKGYLGQGPLLEPPDTGAMRVTFKLGQCYPGSRYFVTDHSIAPAAAMTKTIFAPRLQGGPSKAGATGRTNVFMNGLAGPGPMGFQPSVFDFDAGDSEWSPYWDHFTYAWNDEDEARLLTSQGEIHAARDGGDLNEFPGMPETKGMVFTVNCPVPVLAPPTFTG